MEQLAQGASDVKTEGFERGAHLVGMSAGLTGLTRTGLIAAVKALADKCERTSAVTAFHFEELAFKPDPLGAYKLLGVVKRDRFVDRGYFCGYQVYVFVAAEDLCGVEIERRTAPAVAIVGALAAKADEAPFIAKALDIIVDRNVGGKVFDGIVHC